MDFGPLLLALALVLLVIAFVARPFMERASQPTGLAATNDLGTQRDSILIELGELDFDHSTGKVAEDDYQTQRARLVAKGAEILQALDQLQTTADDSPTTNDLDSEIEQLIAARRTSQSSQSSKSSNPKPAACPQCHKPVRSTDKFCPSCGAKLA